MEIICLAFSPKIHSADRFWLASGSRDKLITIFDSSCDYEAVTVLEHHSSTVTSLQFYQHESTLSLLSCSADKTICTKQVDLDLVSKVSDFEQLQLSTGIFKHSNVKNCKQKVFSMDIATDTQFMTTSHEKCISMWQLPELENVWNYTSNDPSEV